MIVVLRGETSPAQQEYLVSWIKSQGIDVHVSHGENYTVLGLIGDTSKIDVELIESLDIVDSVKRITEPFKQCSRKFHPEDTVINVRGVDIGGPDPVFIAGTRVISGSEDLHDLSLGLIDSGVDIIMGNAFYSGVSPYESTGLKAEGLKYLSELRKETGIPVMSEITDISNIDLYDDIDILQVGSRNMQNFELLTELGKTKRPVMLRRGVANTIQELLLSAEYLMAGGNDQVILCERGIRTFETFTRNTFDISSIPVLHSLTHLPVMADPGRAVGHYRYLEDMVYASVACGADGVVIGAYDRKDDSGRNMDAIKPETIKTMIERAKKIRGVTGR